MGRKAVLHSEDVKIEQKRVVSDDPAAHIPEIVKAEKIDNKPWLDELAFNEEPVTIRLESSTEKNAPAAYPFWVDGKGCEVFMNGKWVELTYVPVDQIVTTKRKYLAVMATAKFDSVTTDVGNPSDGTETVKNKVNRRTSASVALSIIEDSNPRGPAWFGELRRRNF